ncbi:MAG UNVERIFIED_CONTAM: hypothetical protein LVT10_13040 [Anaerolineae bacterium]
MRFIDAQLLISAQTTSKHTFALYGATALDLARQGVYHAQGGMGASQNSLPRAWSSWVGRFCTSIVPPTSKPNRASVTGVHYKRGLRSNQVEQLPCDFVVANVTPWTANALLGTHAPVLYSAKARNVRWVMARSCCIWACMRMPSPTSPIITN